MPQRDNVIEEIKRLDALLEYAVEHIRLRRRRQVARRSVATEPRSGRKRPSDEAERIREGRTGGCVGFAEGCGGRGATALPARG